MPGLDSAKSLGFYVFHFSLEEYGTDRFSKFKGEILEKDHDIVHGFGHGGHGYTVRSHKNLSKLLKERGIQFSASKFNPNKKTFSLFEP